MANGFERGLGETWPTQHTWGECWGWSPEVRGRPTDSIGHLPSPPYPRSFPLEGLRLESRAVAVGRDEYF